MSPLSETNQPPRTNFRVLKRDGLRLDEITLVV